MSRSVLPWWLELHHGGSIYTPGIGKSHRPEPYFFLSGELIVNILPATPLTSSVGAVADLLSNQRQALLSSERPPLDICEQGRARRESLRKQTADPMRTLRRVDSGRGGLPEPDFAAL